MNKTLKIAVIIMTVITLAVIVLGSRQVFGHIEGDFQNNYVIWGFIILFGVFAAVQVVCLFLYPFNLKKIGFYILHIGLVMTLAGCLVYYLSGIQLTGIYYVDPNGSANAVHEMKRASVLKGENYTANFNSFTLGLTNFKVEYYDPVYDLYKGPDLQRIGSDIEINSEDYYDFGGYGKKHKDALVKDGEYQMTQFDDGVVAAPRSSVKYYRGDLTLVNKEKKETSYETIEVNKPVRINGWKIYLMGYNDTDNAATFIFKYDPGEYITLAGMWMIILGSFVSCFIRTEKKAGDAK